MYGAVVRNLPILNRYFFNTIIYLRIPIPNRYLNLHTKSFTVYYDDQVIHIFLWKYARSTNRSQVRSRIVRSLFRVLANGMSVDFYGEKNMLFILCPCTCVNLFYQAMTIKCDT